MRFAAIALSVPAWKLMGLLGWGRPQDSRMAGSSTSDAIVASGRSGYEGSGAGRALFQIARMPIRLAPTTSATKSSPTMNASLARTPASDSPRSNIAGCGFDQPI